MQDTYFAPSKRVSQDELLAAVQHCSRHPMLGVLLQGFGGVMAVLNPERQILSVNTALLEMLSITDAEAVFGLRPGEAIQCTHAEDHPGGCGTSRHCSTCGAAIALVTCQEQGAPQDATCVVTVNTSNGPQDLRLKVRATPFDLEEAPLVLLVLEDISLEHRRAALERTFFHDLNNLLIGLQGTAYLLDCHDPEDFDELKAQLERQADRLGKEVAIQRTLSKLQPESHRVVPTTCDVGVILDDLRTLFEHHPAAEGRELHVEAPPDDCRLRTDPVLAGRVLNNMVLNAFEATDRGGVVRVWAERDEQERVTFLVWNERVIPPDLQGRIFQRYFSTKRGDGRGTGTFAMKLIGEEYLRGEVGFTSAPGEGTTFRLRLPQLQAPVAP